jgi:hypothetical protein
MKWNRSTETTLLLISISATDDSKFPDTKKIGPDRKLAISVTNCSSTPRESLMQLPYNHGMIIQS